MNNLHLPSNSRSAATAWNFPLGINGFRYADLNRVRRLIALDQLFRDELRAADLPGAWNEKYRHYLGIAPPNDSEGVLQDIHWTSGFGYFPTYTLGNLYAAQIFSKLHTVFPDFDARLASGDTTFVLNWLRQHMYAFGAIYQPEELMQRLTGEPPHPQYFNRYLTGKFEKIYHLPQES